MKLKEAKLFIPLRNGGTRQECKAPLEQGWQNKETKHWHELQTHPNIGMRLDGLVAIDFDNLTQTDIELIIAEAIKYKCIIHLTGDPKEDKKGLQLIFKEPLKSNGKSKLEFTGNNLPLLLGMSADIKAGNKGQIVIKLAKYDGDRTANSWHLNSNRNYEVDELEELPKLFMPLAKQQSAEKKIIWGEGTRNEMWMLYTRFLTQGFDKITEAEAIKYCQDVHDRFKVGNEDFKAIVPDWFKKARKIGKFEDSDRLFWRTTLGVLVPERLVDSAIENLFIRRYNGELYIKSEGHFLTEEDNGTIKTSLYDLDTKLTASQVNAAVDKLKHYAPIGELHKDWKYLIYTPTRRINTLTRNIEFMNDDNEFFLHSFSYDYDPNAYDENLDRFLNDISLNRPAVRQDILQALAVGLIPESFRKLFMFYGSGSNGKGTLFKMFTNLFASKTIKHIALEKIIEDQFMANMMKDTIVNISDELSQQYFKEFGTIKSLISNDEIHGRAMHATGKSFIPHVTLYLQGNMIPKTKEKTDAINNRLVFIPMEFTPKKQTAVSSFSAQFLTDNAQKYLFRLLVEKIIAIQMAGSLKYSEESERLHKTFASSNDPVLAWMEAKGKIYFINQETNTSIIFSEYLLSDDAVDISQKQLTTKIKNHFNLKLKTNGYKNPDTGEWKGSTFIEDKDLQN